MKKQIEILILDVQLLQCKREFLQTAYAVKEKVLDFFQKKYPNDPEIVEIESLSFDPERLNGENGHESFTEFEKSMLKLTYILRAKKLSVLTSEL